MTQKTKHILTIFISIVLIISCENTSPDSFWTNFHKEFILTKKSNQGPWGGLRQIKWKSEVKNTFTDNEFINFAHKNDWKLIDSVSFSVDTLTKNSFYRLKNDDYSIDILNEMILPKIKSKDNKIFIFKTTWLNIEPGNTAETFENGFAVLNSDRTELKVFHLWGE